MMPTCLVLAAGLFAEVDPISGGAGWVGAGLLGLVLSWLLLKHLPDKDRQIQALLEVKDKQIADVIRTHEGMQTKMLDAFTESLREERTVYQRWHEENRDRLDSLKGDLKEQRHYLANLANQLGMRQVIEAKLESEAKARSRPGNVPSEAP